MVFYFLQSLCIFHRTYNLTFHSVQQSRNTVTGPCRSNQFISSVSIKKICISTCRSKVKKKYIRLMLKEKCINQIKFDELCPLRNGAVTVLSEHKFSKFKISIDINDNVAEN